uniref:acid phosphatase n=1 Tax=Plectus sambesii TaxID=2011161 RepID=A0A914VMX3_9BILA
MKGVREHYELGKYLRQRYDGFLSKAYHASQIYVRSSSFNRAIMSASANMAGLFEPEGDQLWNKQIRWQPVPIQVVPKENDPMLWTKRPCPAATQLFEDFKKSSSELRRIEQKYARLLTFLGQKTGLNRTLQLYNDVYDVFDLLNCQIYYRNDTTRDAYHIDIGECPRPCTLNQFGARSVPRIPRDWYKECGINECRDQKSLRI